MTGLDTNVLVRFLTADDPAQHARAREFIRSRAAGEGEAPRLFVAPVALCELVWVLQSAYRQSRPAVAAVLQGLLDSRDIVIGDRDAVEAAAVDFRDRRGDFADYYLREASLAAGCEDVATFDAALLKESGFRPL